MPPCPPPPLLPLRCLALRRPHVAPAGPATAIAIEAARRYRHRAFHASARCCSGGDTVARKNHYERLNVRHDASPNEIKKSFYALSKTHHPDTNPSDPSAAGTFSLLSESYTLLSDPARRAAYDRDVLRLHHPHHRSDHHPHHRTGSYSSTSAANPAGGRAPSGLSRRRGTFRGPPPSFYRSGGWGPQAEKRRKAHKESTGGAGQQQQHGSSETTSSSSTNPWAHAHHQHHQHQHQHQHHHHHHPHHAGMGPGASSPFHDAAADAAPHFDREGHTRTHQREDRRRWQRARRAVGDDDVEFEPQTSLAGHFFIVAGILGATFLAPLLYLQFMRLGRRKKEHEH